jgi:para-nitrobenzyl esterase
MMNRTYSTRTALSLFCAVLVAVAIVSSTANGGVARRSDSPVVITDSGIVRGLAAGGGYVFRGLPYAAPPTGALRWRPPQPPKSWKGVRDATTFAPTCPQVLDSGEAGPGPFSEDCLYLNVYTQTLHRKANRPVIVWIHGGGLTQDASRNYDGSKLAADGAVVVTINYRLGPLGFLAHPALAAHPGGPTGNYGLMDQQAALRWVRKNIDQFGGDKNNVTIAGQSAGGLSVLAHLVSRGSRGLFDRAIVESGAFALNQQSLGSAESAGEAFAAKAGCADQTAACLRSLPVSALVNHDSGIPGVVDGKVLTEPIGQALEAGHFAHVPILNGISHNEEFLFVVGLGVAVSNGSFVGVPSSGSYESTIASVMGVTPARAAAIAALYPPVAPYPSSVPLSIAVSDANFACPALQVDRWTSKHAPTFAYEFDDDSAPQRFAPPGALPPIATHSSEIQYLLDQPNTPVPATLDATQEQLAATMRAGWTAFAAGGDPSTAAMPWPAFNGSNVLSLNSPQPQLMADFSATHHCDFWAAG